VSPTWQSTWQWSTPLASMPISLLLQSLLLSLWSGMPPSRSPSLPLNPSVGILKTLRSLGKSQPRVLAPPLPPHPPATLDNLTVPSWDNPAPAQPLLPPAVPTFTLAPIVNASPPGVTTSSTRLRIKQLQAQVLAMSGVPPPADGILVDTPIPVRRPLSTSAPHSPANVDSPVAFSPNNTAPVQPLPPQAVPTPVPTPLVKDSPSMATTGSTRLLAQQLQAQVLVMSGIPPPAADTLVGPSMSTKDLLRHLQRQVTSLSAAGIQQPTAAGTPQTPAVVFSPPGSVPTDPGSGE